MKHFNSYIIIFTLMLGNFILSQNTNSSSKPNNIDRIIPPSPTAFKFSNYGNLSLNGNSGGFSNSIPLYQIQFKDISMPITANYYSAGVKVDDLAGIVGTDWNLKAGGVISRVVKDFPDEKGVRVYPEENEFNEYNSTYSDKIKNIARDMVQGSVYDGEQDWFNFNFNGISGSFFFDENLQPHLLSEQNLNISYKLSSQSNQIIEFKIIDDFGYQYVFGGDDTFVEKTTVSNQCDYTFNIEANTAWFLKEMISPSNNSISFQYENNEYTYYDNMTSDYTIAGACPEPTSYMSPFAINICVSSIYTKSKVLSSISFNNSTISFSYNNQRQDKAGKSLKEINISNGISVIKKILFQYDEIFLRQVPLYTTSEDNLNYRLFLNSIIFQGNNDSNPEVYKFEYYSPNLMPRRLSYSKDKYGYVNGSYNIDGFDRDLKNIFSGVPGGSNMNFNADLNVNPNTVYYGMLKKIIYPTKGYSLLNYEANSSSKLVESSNIDYTLNLVKYDCAQTPVSQSFEFVSDGSPISFFATANYQGGVNCNNGTTNDYYTVQFYKNNQLFLTLANQYGASLESNQPYCGVPTSGSTYDHKPICTEAGSTYKVVLTLMSDFAFGKVDLFYKKNFINEFYYGGGARIQNIIDYNDNIQVNKKKYFYNSLVNYPSDSTSIQNYYEPQFSTGYSIITYCDILGGACKYAPKIKNMYKVSSNAVNLGFYTRNPISYSSITEFYENDIQNRKGAIEKKFFPSISSPGRMYLGYKIYGSSPSNESNLHHDKIIEENLYDFNDSLLIAKKYDYVILGNGYVTSTSAKKDFPFPWDEDFPPPGIDHCDSPTYYSPLRNYSVWTYKNYYGIVKIKSQDITEYYKNGKLDQKTNFVYGLQTNFNLEKSNITYSDSAIQETTYQYAYEKGNQFLIDKNMIGIPLQTTITKTVGGVTKTLSDVETKYPTSQAEADTKTNSLPLPYVVESKTLYGSSIDKELTYDRYDDKGNILQYSEKGLKPTVIIWGYNKTQPIAKIEGAKYDDIKTIQIVLDAITASDTDDTQGTASSEQSLLTALDNLRINSSFSNYTITTYTYDPLIGVTSITPPSGIREIYKYDSSNRLQSVVDINGKILKEYQYNYKQ